VTSTHLLLVVQTQSKHANTNQQTISFVYSARLEAIVLPLRGDLCSSAELSAILQRHFPTKEGRRNA